MKRRILAIHESGHAVLAHYAGLKVRKITMDETGGEITAGFIKDKPTANDAAAYIYITVAGLIAQALDFGDELWELYSKGEVTRSDDYKKLQELEICKHLTKHQFVQMLKDVETYLSTPTIWGKVDFLADEIIDHPKGDLPEEVWVLLGRCQRQRTPEYKATRMVSFLADRLFN